MEPSEHVAAIGEEGGRIGAVLSSTSPAAAVPCCPRWRLRDLVAHLGYVHRWAASVIAGALAELPEEVEEAEILAMAPADGELADWFQGGLALLVSALVAAPDDLECAHFLPASSPKAFWARRQAHETAVHRLDAELAAGHAVTPLAVPFALDGIEELLFGFLARRAPRSGEQVDAVLGLRATDIETAWTVAMGGRGVRASRQLDDADLVLSASASDLYRLLWNRPTDGPVGCEGDQTVLDRWRERYAITW